MMAPIKFIDLFFTVFCNEICIPLKNENQNTHKIRLEKKLGWEKKVGWK